ncbi:hypothetical protein NSPZN2_10742 [Nitrospira defluvii]|uniref:RES domain-containing protein n=1 Tax=Nitrospira defluvii TaxID=330214 RepID=A0ABN7KMJ7_9BACT|nr:hypothetical protein NSPZN2_10742 [Nitrospira defluvii]
MREHNVIQTGPVFLFPLTKQDMFGQSFTVCYASSNPSALRPLSPLFPTCIPLSIAEVPHTPDDSVAAYAVVILRRAHQPLLCHLWSGSGSAILRDG